MDEPLDDTVIAPPRVAAEPSILEPDLDDTIVPVGAANARPAKASVRSDRAQAYYSFSIGAHVDVIALDVPAYIGRRPSLPRVSKGGMPRLVSVPSPRKEVSSTHLEVRQLGSSVIVTDLKSTNGSIVIVPGSVPRKLRQGESVVVSPGTLVDIGDDNVIQILPVGRLAP